MAAHDAQVEVLRTSYSQDGTYIVLLYDCVQGRYRLATRWYWLASFDSIWDACDAFEALEMLEGCVRSLAKTVKGEIKRVPRHQFIKPNGMMRIGYLVRSVERRAAGLRPQRCGSKGSVERWIPV